MKNLIVLILLIISWDIAVAQENKVRIAHLSMGDTSAFSSIRRAFVESNPGYDLNYLPSVREMAAKDYMQVVFIQKGEGEARIYSDQRTQQSELTVGDMVLLRKGQSLQSDRVLGLLVFTVPDAPQEAIPSFIRPDWDPNITDTPGGCATETNAYRRILLTWKEEVGNYLFHALNAHRVRITDSFTHYHPVAGGFDEFYLVQMVQPGARIITSDKTDLIIHPQKIAKEEARNLFQERALVVGDLVYLPRV